MMNELFGEFLGTFNPYSSRNWCCCWCGSSKNQEQQLRLDCDYYGLGDCSCGCSICIWQAQSSSFKPAVTIGVALKGGLPWASVFPYILAQFAGAMLGQILVWLQFKPHYEAEENAGNILATSAQDQLSKILYQT